MENETRPAYIVRVASTMLTLSLIVVLLHFLQPVIVPVLIAVILAIMIFPFAARFEKWGFSKGLAAFVTILILSVVLGVLTYIILTQLASFTTRIPELSQKFNSILDNLRDFASQKFGMKRSEAGNMIQEKVKQLETYSGEMLSDLLSKLPVFMLNLFMIPLYMFFLLYFRHFFLEFFYKVFYDSNRTDIDETMESIGKVIKDYLFGQFLDIVIIGAANAIVLYFIGIPYAIALGFLLAVFCIIPYLGMIAGSAMIFVIALLTTNTDWQPLTALGVLWVIHIIDSNIVAPAVIGSKVNINPLIAILVLFLFGELWGLPGLFLAFPLAAILKVIFDRVPALKAWGFLLGEPQKYHLKKYSLPHLRRKMNLADNKKMEPMEDKLPGETGVNPLPGDNIDLTPKDKKD